MRLYIKDKRMAADLASIEHTAANPNYTTARDDAADGATGDIAPNKWNYLVWSFALLAGDKGTTRVTFFIGNTARATTKDFEGVNIYDGEAFPIFLGVAKTGDSAYDTHFNGYIHDFAVG
ncbi:MAG: hypothetical protein V2I33_21240 [Kangiellaceae bacterium]|jgi:hypothetical protein|nr:hypothetical protein [Kangiellaceae bacterium]